MTPRRDRPYAMAPRPLDDANADRFFAGTLPPAHTPAALARASVLVHAAQLPSTSEATEAPAAVLAAFAAAAGHRAPAPVRRRRAGVRAITIAATVLIGATSAAAATGQLPDAAQDAIADLAEHLGIDLPRPPAPPAPGPGTILPSGTTGTDPAQPPGTEASTQPAAIVDCPPATPTPACLSPTPAPAPGTTMASPPPGTLGGASTTAPTATLPAPPGTVPAPVPPTPTVPPPVVPDPDPPSIPTVPTVPATVPTTLPPIVPPPPTVPN